ncbi:hypothetical protein AB5I41_19655 [Sphingomonas sp. MMS24-JH45]
MSVKAERTGWLSKAAAKRCDTIAGPNSHVEHFRSDNDLHQWRAFGWFAVPLTAMSVGLLQTLNVPFRYSPVALIPASLLAGAFRLRAWRDRQKGRRFSDYDADDLG